MYTSIERGLSMLPFIEVSPASRTQIQGELDRIDPDLRLSVFQYGLFIASDCMENLNSMTKRLVSEFNLRANELLRSADKRCRLLALIVNLPSERDILPERKKEVKKGMVFVYGPNKNDKARSLLFDILKGMEVNL